MDICEWSNTLESSMVCFLKLNYASLLMDSLDLNKDFIEFYCLSYSKLNGA